MKRDMTARRERNKGTEETFETIMDDKFSKRIPDTKTQIWRIPSRTDARKLQLGI